MDTGYQANPEHFAMQLEVFDRMREIEKEFRAASLQGRAGALPASPKLEAPQDAAPFKHESWCTAWAPCHDTSYPRGVIDLRRLTGRNLLSIEPGRNWK